MPPTLSSPLPTRPSFPARSMGGGRAVRGAEDEGKSSHGAAVGLRALCRTAPYQHSTGGRGAGGGGSGPASPLLGFGGQTPHSQRRGGGVGLCPHNRAGSWVGSRLWGQLGVVRAQLSPCPERELWGRGRMWGEMLPLCAPPSEYKNQHPKGPPPPFPTSSPALPLPKVNVWFRKQTANPLPPPHPPPQKDPQNPPGED